jgi:hypothetical protein
MPDAMGKTLTYQTPLVPRNAPANSIRNRDNVDLFNEQGSI